MLDYIKISIKNIDIDRLLSLPMLDFKVLVSESTGDIDSKKKAMYHYCEITVFNNEVVLFSGSIHKLWNSLNGVLAPNKNEHKIYKGFNGNQFTLKNVLEVRKHLQELFNCVAEQMIFQNIEFGINTTPVFNPQLYIKGLLYHNGKLFESRYNEHFAQVIHQRYYIKIYNKSNQYGMEEPTLRVELKVKKMEEVKCLGVKTFADINAFTLSKASQLLLKRFDEVVYYDNTLSRKSMTNHQKQALDRYSNPHYWIDVLAPKNRDKHKKKLKEFIIENSNDLYQQIRQEINQKALKINQSMA